LLAFSAVAMAVLVVFGRQTRREELLADSVRVQVAAANKDANERYRKMASQYEDTKYSDAEDMWKRMDSHEEEQFKDLGSQGKELKEDFPGLEKDDALVYRNGLSSWGDFYDGGLGTFPGGQSTGGNSEFGFEREAHLAKNPPTRHDIVAREMERQVWGAVGGACKEKLKVDEMEDCVSKTLKLDPSSKVDQRALDIADRQWHALRRPATEDVHPTGKFPSLEDVIEFNGKKHQNIDLHKAKEKMAGLQKELKKIVNHRNLDTEHLTEDSNNLWMSMTANLCCKDEADTDCVSPCNSVVAY